MFDPAVLLSLIVFLPAIGAVVLAFLPSRQDETLRYVTLAITLLVLVLCIVGFFGSYDTKFDIAATGMQSAFHVPWIPSFDIYYAMGVDGISFPLLILTAAICALAMGASWSIKKHVKAYCILFLLLETGMLGVFLALDFFLFYVFWEVMLLPMYFLIGVWGGPRREYAAIKFFLYTLVGSVLMLIAILLLYFNSDLRKVADISNLNGNASATVDWNELKIAPRVELRVRDATDDRPVHSFNLLALAAMGQHTDCFDEQLLGWSVQEWAFILLFIGFAIKVPSVPLHTWLPDAHVEAPTPISMILAGVLLKMGGYGIIRICYPICPHGGYEWAFFVCSVGVISMVYGAFAALAQKDFKRMVAYSSVSHMGYVVLGLGVWSAAQGNMYNADYWNMGVQGAMFQMIAHGVSSAGMFFMVGVIYDRVHHRNLDEFGGLFGKMPVYTALAIGIFFAGLGLPGLCGFVGEVFVVLSVFNYSITLAVISASVVILTAGYILWAVQRVYLGAEYRGPHEENLTPATARENTIAGVLFVFAILFGVLPYHTVLKYMDATITHQVEGLAALTREYEAEAEEAAAATETAEEQRPQPSVLPTGGISPAALSEDLARATSVHDPLSQPIVHSTAVPPQIIPNEP
jgi:NADH-quinone oxidoreductase subunit M